MALGRRKEVQQQDLFITADSLPKSNGHIFYKKLNELLASHGFDSWIENLCQEFYTQGRGRPSIPPGIYFRMLLVGYFEGIQSQRGIDAIKRYDSGRKHKKVSNEDWLSPVDRDAKITRMKDGTTHLAYRAEHVVDTSSDLIIGAEIQSAIASDNATLEDSLHAAQIHLNNIGATGRIKDVTADKGYHSTQTLTQITEHTDFVTFIPEPKLAEGKKHNWKDKSRKERNAVLNNRKRTQSKKGKKLQRLRSEKVERSFAHTLETGGGRRTHLRGLVKNQKRHFLLTAAYNLGVIMRSLYQMGTARGLGRGLAAFLARFSNLIWLTSASNSLQHRLSTKIVFKDQVSERHSQAFAGI